MAGSGEQARFIRPRGLDGVEALHATFVSHRYAPHVHDTWTIAQVVRGAAHFELEGRPYTAPAGAVFLIPPGAVHTGESASAGGYTYRVLYVEPPLLRDPLAGQPASARLPGQVVVYAEGLTRALTRLHASLRVPGILLEQGEALTGVSRSALELAYAPGTRPARGSQTHPAVSAARSYIHERWRENFTLGELARAAGLSTFALVRTFHDQVGMPPSAYRRALRVQAAQRLLRAGMTPASAALESGFYDQSHLNRHFKRVTGVTPAQYAAATA